MVGGGADWVRVSTSGRSSIRRITHRPHTTFSTTAASPSKASRSGAAARPSSSCPCLHRAKRAAGAQAALDLETYTENAKINEIRGYLAAWRAVPNPADWGVTPVSQRLLEHWRRPKEQWAGPRPFFCQIEAVETIIWLTEVAPRRAATRGLRDQIAKDNEEANPALFRLAMKMATGSGKTTVMAMLIAWHAINAARKEAKDFSRAFLIVAPGITIKDRLRVLQPSEPGNYYDTREIVPPRSCSGSSG